MNEREAILAANAAYYTAFVAGDFPKMSGIWADEEVSCVHPGWPVLIGRKPILESYANILRNPNQERIEHHNDTALISGNDGRVFCVEIVGGMALAVTNWFRRIDGAWRMIHHQASPISAMMVEEGAEEVPPGRLN
jgi:hypothetical protein